MPNPPRPVYLHGLPGSDRELSLFGPELGQKLASVIIPNRNSPALFQNSQHYFDELAAQVRQSCADTPIHLIGFSLGAAAAIQLATRLSTQVARIDLVSAAAPLQSGRFIDYMAGGPLFKAAMKRPRLFKAAVRLQSLAANRVPKLLFRVLFAGARADDRWLREDPQFRLLMMDNLTQSLGRDFQSYQREIGYYVEDWSSLVPSISQPVKLWHGEDDNWTPPAMAEALAAALPNVAALHRLKSKSHFSTLQYYLEHWSDDNRG
jgi:pimeloyl-ACP methyl ester carboxylesterase